MKFKDLLQKAGDLPCFTTSFMAAGENLAQIRLQLNRWVKNGRLIRLRKGLYVLSDPYRKIKPELFAVANAIKSPSYVSFQSALSWYGLIPEFTFALTCVTTARPQIIVTPLGRFEYRHISKDLFWGFQQTDLSQKQTCFIARPEKALLDLVYFTAGGEKKEFLEELRLQNLEKLNRRVLEQFAEKSKSPKLRKAVSNIEIILDEPEGIEL